LRSGDSARRLPPWRRAAWRTFWGTWKCENRQTRPVGGFQVQVCFQRSAPVLWLPDCSKIPWLGIPRFKLFFPELHPESVTFTSLRYMDLEVANGAMKERKAMCCTRCCPWINLYNVILGITIYLK
jgi:hypothetical protein